MIKSLSSSSSLGKGDQKVPPNIGRALDLLAQWAAQISIKALQELATLLSVTNQVLSEPISKMYRLRRERGWRRTASRPPCL